MRYSLVDSLTWVYPDSDTGPKPCLCQEIDVARGATVATTIVINDTKPGTRIKLAVRSKHADRIRFFRLVDVPVEKNTGLVGYAEKPGERNRFVTRRAPFRVYDAMQPIGSSFKSTGTTEAVRLHIPVAEDARPGKQEYLLTLTCGNETGELKLGVTVHRPVIPPVGRDSWAYTNWFSLNLMATRHCLKPWSEAHWGMIRRYARLMARNRQNTFMVSLNDIFTIGKSGPMLNRQRMRRLIETFSAAGLYYIEGGHLGRHSSSSEKNWPYHRVGLTGHLAVTAEGNAELAIIGRALSGEINANGWSKRWLQHVADEPIEKNATDYRLFVGMVRKYMPGIPIVDATLARSLAGAVDIWCPQAQHYQKNRDHFEEMRATGDRVWFYTACFPGGPWLNRLLDMELIRPALLGWGGFLFHMDGFLHWGLNHYRQDQNPFEMSVLPGWLGTEHCLPAGDTHVVYPGKDTPWSSVRFESQREGIEDMELLRLLAQKKPGEATSLVRSVIRGFDDYTRKVAVLRAARQKLLQMLS